MSGILISRFSGETPRFAPELLPDNGAQLASNCRLTSGELQPWAGLDYVVTLGKWSAGDPIVSVYRTDYNGADYWLHWVDSELLENEVVKVFPSPVVGDTFDRLYFNKGGVLYVTTKALATQGVGTDYPLAAYTLGVAPPTDTPVVAPAASQGPTITDATIAYVYTFVTIYGEESAPSPSQTELASGAPIGGATPWTVTMASTPSAGTNAPYQYRRVYRTFTATDGTTTFQFVAEIPEAQTSYVDSVTDAALGEALSTDGFATPPTAISAFAYFGNGVFAALSGKTLYLSEPFHPHAWPASYARAIGFEGVGMEAIGNSLIVLTNGDPIVLTGTDPTFLSDAKLDINQPCVGSATVINVGPSVAYMSPVGYIYAGLGGSNVLTRNLFSKTDWRGINPSTASFATRYDDGVMFFTSSHQYLVTPDEPMSLLTSVNVDEVNSLYTDAESGEVYLVRNEQLLRWDADTAKLAYLWRSKVFVSPRPVNMGVCQIISDAGEDSTGNTVDVPGGLGINESGINGAPLPYMTTDPILTFRLYAFDPTPAVEAYVLKHTETITGHLPFTLPSGYKADSWYFELEGTAEVKRVLIAETRKDLKAMAS